ncbi:hypothetical protein HUG17_9505 [Dermatophagoides farinae]|nr:hypothetical protein HUG17_9505 [Dermatophagoides farinae]
MEHYEQQLNELSRQLSDYRMEFSEKYQTIMTMFEQLSDAIIGNVHHQQSSSSSQTNQSSDIRAMVCLDDDGDDRIQHKLRRLPAIVRGYLVRRLLSTGKIRNLRRTIRDTSAILVNFKKNLQTNTDDGRLIVTEQDVLFHRQLCAQLEKSCHEFYRIFFQLSMAKRMELIRNDREHSLNRSDSITSQYSTSLSSSSSSVFQKINRKKILNKILN